MALPHQGMIQKLELFTSQLSEQDNDTLLRLHNGQIQKGPYKGSFLDTLKYIVSGQVLNKLGRETRKEYLTEVSSAESTALADALCTDISLRTPAIYEAPQSISTKEAQKLLEASAEERDRFNHLINELVTTTLSYKTSSESDSNNTTIPTQLLTEHGITRFDQVHFLKKQVVAQIQKSAFHRDTKKLKQLAERRIESMMLALANLKQNASANHISQDDTNSSSPLHPLRDRKISASSGITYVKKPLETDPNQQLTVTKEATKPSFDQDKVTGLNPNRESH